ncbi:hypothetical protein [Streptomyces sp. NPDC004658]|uniref:hypothetical protein n=1 Tax=Streptomyces sp. NPDC004658 TaxID=3154672 RepID=UPI0033A133EA
MAVITAARAAYEILRYARRTPAQDDLRDLRGALLALGPTAPTDINLDVITAHDELGEAADDLKNARDRRDFTARRAALRRLDEVFTSIEKIILTIDPTADRPLELEDIPATAADIVSSTLGYNAAYRDDPEVGVASVEKGTPTVRVHCRSDSKLGRMITAVITAGVNTAAGFVPAHPPVARTFTRRDGRLNAAETARRALRARMTFVAVPVQWINDRAG